METIMKTPAWLTDTLNEADRRFAREADDLRFRIDSDALTEAMREHTPVGLPDLDWRVSRWSDGAHNIWACPNKSVFCMFPNEIRENAAVFAAWLEALEGPAAVEAAPIEGISNPALVFQAKRQLAGVDFTLSFRPWHGQIGVDEVRRIVAEAVAS
jgi:hypothetical protein